MALINKIEPLPYNINNKMLYNVKIKGYRARFINKIVSFNILALRRY
jgi:hypothetical protein